jgi:Mrp family chromosome partitioning ATPase
MSDLHPSSTIPVTNATPFGSGPRDPEESAEQAAPHHELVLVRQDQVEVHTTSVVLPDDLDRRLVLAKDRSSQQANSYRLLRHRLACQGDPRVIAVTSAIAGEGKTTCALNLASALGEESSIRVLLLEANTLSPALAHVFRLDVVHCAARQLAVPHDVFVPWMVSDVLELSLHVAAVSPVPPVPPLDRFLFERAIQQLRTRYDYIVIDTPAALASADATLAAECAEGVLLAARTRLSKRQLLRKVTEQLTGSTILGVALHDVRDHKMA